MAPARGPRAGAEPSLPARVDTAVRGVVRAEQRPLGAEVGRVHDGPRADVQLPRLRVAHDPAEVPELQRVAVLMKRDRLDVDRSGCAVRGVFERVVEPDLLE